MPQSQSVDSVEEKYLLPLPGFEIRTIAVATELLRLLL